MSAPRISGTALRSVARVAQTKVGALALKRLFLADLKMSDIAKLPDELFGDVPIDTRPLAGRPPRAHGANGAAALGALAAPWSGTSATLADAYRAKKTTPSEIVAHALRAARELASRTPSVGPLMAYADDAAREEAEASTARWAKGAPIGPLDGSPFVVKEQTSVRGFARGGGTTFEDPNPRAEDATVVLRLRAAGAIVIGTSPMTEYGMNPIGYNPKRTMPRNPHATGCVAGGSSTGSGVAVATGLVPFALGVDGGGSIRVPSALNGVFGIKPTWGRVSRFGDLAGGTVAHVGPLATSTLDLARVLEAIGARDPRDPQTDGAPAIAAGQLEAALARGVRGLRIGVDAHEWSCADAIVGDKGRDALRALEREGAVLVDVESKLARWAAAAGYLTIAMEDFAMQRAHLRERPREFNLDLQVSYAVLGELGAAEYCEGMRLRSGIRAEMAALFRDIDLFAIPSTVTTAPRITDDDMRLGFLDTGALDAMCRYSFLGNITGLPALSAPVGRDREGLPIGLQLVGDAYDEATVLAAAAHLERLGAARAERPSVSVDVLASAR
jgi:aspartyl-tRNA(Asn)/glutamyl-tRNA(Gln) amidotransferase subunit A